MIPKLLDPFAEADRLVREAFAWDGRELADERAFDLHRTAQEMAAEGGPMDDDFDMPDDDEPAEDMDR
jgi:hypothetical protein